MKEKKNYVKKNCPKENQSNTVGEKEKEETKKKGETMLEREKGKQKKKNHHFVLFETMTRE